jgi:hypothetical protein
VRRGEKGDRKKEAGNRKQELRGVRRQGSGFRYYLGEEISNMEQFLNPEPCLLNP